MFNKSDYIASIVIDGVSLAFGTDKGNDSTAGGIQPLIKPPNTRVSKPVALDTVTTSDRIVVFYPTPITLQDGTQIPVPESIRLILSDMNDRSPLLNQIYNQVDAMRNKYREAYEEILEENKDLKNANEELQRELNRLRESGESQEQQKSRRGDRRRSESGFTTRG